MRLALASLLLAFGAGPGLAQPGAGIDEIELRLFGANGVDIEINRQGEGRYAINRPDSTEPSRALSVSPAEFDRLRERLRPFRAQAVPMSDESIERFIERACPQGVPFIEYRGAIWIRWSGPAVDEHVQADLGCDPDRHAERNRALLEIVRTLPLPRER